MKALKGTRCSLCHATVIAWARPGVSGRLLRLLAVAEHVQTIHGIKP